MKPVKPYELPVGEYAVVHHLVVVREKSPLPPHPTEGETLYVVDVSDDIVTDHFKVTAPPQQNVVTPLTD